MWLFNSLLWRLHSTQINKECKDEASCSKIWKGRLLGSQWLLNFIRKGGGRTEGSHVFHRMDSRARRLLLHRFASTDPNEKQQLRSRAAQRQMLPETMEV
jgi:hypothetical protein